MYESRERILQFTTKGTPIHSDATPSPFSGEREFLQVTERELKNGK